MLSKSMFLVFFFVFSVKCQSSPKPYLTLESISESGLVSYGQLYNRSNAGICGHFDVLKPSKRCAIGVWVLYNGLDFQNTEIALAAREFECFDEPDMALKSVRQVGSTAGIFDSVLTQFEGLNYAGAYNSSTGDNSDYSAIDITRSLILTGTRGVELFGLPGYEGDSVCVSPMVHNMIATAIPDIQNDPQFPFSTIRSLRFGCIVENNYDQFQNKYLPITNTN